MQFNINFNYKEDVYICDFTNILLIFISINLKVLDKIYSIIIFKIYPCFSHRMKYK